MTLRMSPQIWGTVRWMQLALHGFDADVARQADCFHSLMLVDMLQSLG